MDLRRAALAVGFLLLASCLSHASAQPMERPAWNVGDTWEFSLQEYGTGARGGNFFAVESFTVRDALPEGFAMAMVVTDSRSGTPTTTDYRVTRDLNFFARQNPSLPRQEVKWQQWPLEPGKTWKYERPVAAGVQVWDARVTGWDDVEVPAGKFKAIRVVIDLVSSPDPLVGWQSTFWFVPEVKWFVKRTDYGTYESAYSIKRDTRELKSYKLH